MEGLHSMRQRKGSAVAWGKRWENVPLVVSATTTGAGDAVCGASAILLQ